MASFTGSAVLLGVLVLVLVVFLLAAFLNWRRLALLLMFWVLIEGLVRRAIPGQPPQVMLVTDALVFFVYASFFSWWVVQHNLFVKRTWLPPFLLPLSVFCFFAVVGIFNPRSPGILVGLVGFHSYVWYVPLLWVGFATFDNWDSARRFFWWLSVAAIPMAVLALYQCANFGSLPAALRPIEGESAVHSNVTAGLEMIKLVPSSFVNAEKFSRYCLMTFFLSLGLLLEKRGTRSKSWLLPLATLASVAGVFLSGRRSPLYFSLVGFIWLMFGFFRKLGVRKSLQWIGIIALATATALTAARSRNQNAGFYQESTASIPEFALYVWSDMEYSFRNSGLIGIGTGTNSQGIGYVPGGLEWWSTSQLIPETGLGYIMGELGVIGLVAFVLLLLSMSIAWFKNVGRLRGKAPYPVGASLAVFFSMMLVWFAKGHQILGDPITLVHFWFLMGIFFALPRYHSSCQRTVRQGALWGTRHARHFGINR